MDFKIQNHQDTRSGFGDGLYELGKTNPRIVGLCADLIGSLKMGAFANEFPDRFFQTGISEANMMGMAAGRHHLRGFIPSRVLLPIFRQAGCMIKSGNL